MFKTPAVNVHGAAAPVSNPGLPINCCAAAELIVKPMVVVWLSVPEVPVTVTVADPTVAVLLAVNVRTLVEVVGLVPKLAVTPLGRPEAESVTDPVKPFEGATVIVLLPFVPCFTVRLEGEAESEKLGCAGAFTVKLIVVVWVVVPDVPVTVTVAFPVVAVLLAFNVRTLVEVVGFVPKVAVTPVGKPEAERLTDPVKPLIGITVIVLLPLVPCVTVSEEGDAESE